MFLSLPPMTEYLNMIILDNKNLNIYLYKRLLYFDLLLISSANYRITVLQNFGI